MTRSSRFGDVPDSLPPSSNDLGTARSPDLPPTGLLIADGAVWRAAAWVACLLGGVLMQYFAGLERAGIWHEVSIGGFRSGMAAFAVLCVGITCGFRGASLASSAGDRRFLNILPVYANIVLLMWLFSRVLKPT